jgi:hypothetical protein
VGRDSFGNPDHHGNEGGERGALPTYQLTQPFPSMELAANHFWNIISWFGFPNELCVHHDLMQMNIDSLNPVGPQGAGRLANRTLAMESLYVRGTYTRASEEHLH